MPLVLTLTGANRHDDRMLAAVLDAVPGVRTGRPRRRPAKLHEDNGYDHRRRRCGCRARSVTPRIARRGIESSDHLARFRRLANRYERRADLHLALTPSPSSAGTSQTVSCLAVPPAHVEMAAFVKGSRPPCTPLPDPVMP